MGSKHLKCPFKREAGGAERIKRSRCTTRARGSSQREGKRWGAGEKDLKILHCWA